MSTTAEIREALEWMQHLWCCEDEGMASGQPTAMDYQKARDLVDRALALLAGMEREGEAVAWMSPNGVCISAKMRELGMNDHGKELYSTPLYTHPSPTTADAKESTVDMQEVIRAGDELTKIKGALCNFILSLQPRDRDGHFTKDELDHMTTQWTNATKPFRP